MMAEGARSIGGSRADAAPDLWRLRSLRHAGKLPRAAARAGGRASGGWGYRRVRPRAAAGAALAEGAEAGGGGGDPLVGGGERHPDVPGPGRAVKLAGRHEDADLAQHANRLPAVEVRVCRPQVQAGLRVGYGPARLLERGPQDAAASRVPGVLLVRVAAATERRGHRGLDRGR